MEVGVGGVELKAGVEKLSVIGSWLLEGGGGVGREVAIYAAKGLPHYGEFRQISTGQRVESWSGSGSKHYQAFPGLRLNLRVSGRNTINQFWQHKVRFKPQGSQIHCGQTCSFFVFVLESANEQRDCWQRVFSGPYQIEHGVPSYNRVGIGYSDHQLRNTKWAEASQGFGSETFRFAGLTVNEYPAELGNGRLSLVAQNAKRLNNSQIAFGGRIFDRPVRGRPQYLIKPVNRSVVGCEEFMFQVSRPRFVCKPIQQVGARICSDMAYRIRCFLYLFIFATPSPKNGNPIGQGVPAISRSRNRMKEKSPGSERNEGDARHDKLFSRRGHARRMA